jgi:gamma-glutamyl:cysteine ligase YbdK (ATP-grasp superfamily)
MLADWTEFEEYMNTLRAGAIRGIEGVWWEVPPHPDFGMTGIRMFHRGPTPQPVAERMGCAGEVDVLSQALERGAPVERRRALVAAGGGLTDVVDALVTEFAGDRFVRPGEDRYAGH